MKLMRVGVDLAKNVFQVHGVDRNEKPVWRRRLSRKKWLNVLLEMVEPGCEVGCGRRALSPCTRRGVPDATPTRSR